MPVEVRRGVGRKEGEESIVDAKRVMVTIWCLWQNRQLVLVAEQAIGACGRTVSGYSTCWLKCVFGYLWIFSRAGSGRRWSGSIRIESTHCKNTNTLSAGIAPYMDVLLSTHMNDQLSTGYLSDPLDVLLHSAPKSSVVVT